MGELELDAASPPPEQEVPPRCHPARPIALSAFRALCFCAPVDRQTRPGGWADQTRWIRSFFPAAAMSGGGEGGKALSEQSPSDRLPRGTVTVPATFLFGASRAGGTTEVGDGRCLRPSLHPEVEPSWGSRTGTCEVIKGVTANFARSKRVKTLCPSAARKQSLTAQGCPVSRPSRT